MESVTSNVPHLPEDSRVKPSKLKLVHFSKLSAPRQLLVRLFQATNYGCIQKLEVKDSEPVFEPPPVVLIELKLDTDESRPEIDLTDFALRDEVGRLMARLDELKNGVIQRVEIRGGVPRRIVYESRLTEALR
jgi:hypothetical protein